MGEGVGEGVRRGRGEARRRDPSGRNWCSDSGRFWYENRGIPRRGLHFCAPSRVAFRSREEFPGQRIAQFESNPRPRLPRGIPRFSCQDLPWGLYYFRFARHSDSEEQLALPSVRFSCLLPEATPYGYRAAILRMPCNLDASSSIPISSSAW